MKSKISKTIFVLILVVAIIIILYIKFIVGPLLIKIFGISVLIVDSGSMQPTINVGEAIIIQESNKYEEGDIITYNVENQYLITHRIISKTEQGFVTKGDYNNIQDRNIVKYKDVEGKVVFHSKILGFICKYSVGFIIILLAIIILVA